MCLYPKIDIVQTSENIRNGLRKDGMTVNEFAKLMSVSSRTIERWIYGYTLPSISKIILIAHLFDVTLDDLIAVKMMR